MLTLKPTQLRNNLFKTLHKVALGEKVQIISKEGTFYLINSEQAGRDENSNIDKPKLKGRILGTLNDADKKLRKYIKVPE